MVEIANNSINCATVVVVIVVVFTLDRNNFVYEALSPIFSGRLLRTCLMILEHLEMEET